MEPLITNHFFFEQSTQDLKLKLNQLISASISAETLPISPPLLIKTTLYSLPGNVANNEVSTIQPPDMPPSKCLGVTVYQNA
ncbi:hypothetical protein QVD17_06280 [Tagetes erecta]|uniref:Uncharacterized protein n=1 Tax=Tagetes erecta TaxID=13708 RepID=A0AAD8LJ31_TARER|nr:hypothetical protein QVD17_06280 [Tagetes erecta]